jgi:hypothetical protein
MMDGVLIQDDDLAIFGVALGMMIVKLSRGSTRAAIYYAIDSTTKKDLSGKRIGRQCMMAWLEGYESGRRYL